VEFVLHPLIHTPLGFTQSQDVEKKKSGARDSAFSKFKPKYCSLVSRAKVGIKVCKVQSVKKTNGPFGLVRLHIPLFGASHPFGEFWSIPGYSRATLWR